MPAGGRPGGVSVGGRWTHKQVPDIEDDVFFDEPVPMVGERHNWDQLTVHVWGTSTTFTRTVGTNTAGNNVVSVNADCDPPGMLMLARKGDGSYWENNRDTGRDMYWTSDVHDRRIWAAGITCRMLEEGFVHVDGTGVDGILAVMQAASTKKRLQTQGTPHVLGAVVAQLRGFRLIESMQPTTGGGTNFGGYSIPDPMGIVPHDRFNDICDVYAKLQRPPWEDPAMPWGAQPVAGHATTINSEDCFVGEKGDLLWRALTETDLSGLSPLKMRLVDPDVAGEPAVRLDGVNIPPSFSLTNEMITAAGLYDNTAQRQLTTGLFDAIPAYNRRYLQIHMLSVFEQQLNPDTGTSRWTTQQLQRIRGFIDTVEALEP